MKHEITIKTSDIYKGENKESFEAFAKSISHEFTITNFRPPRAGEIFVSLYLNQCFGGPTYCDVQDANYFEQNPHAARLILTPITKTNVIWD